MKKYIIVKTEPEDLPEPILFSDKLAAYQYFAFMVSHELVSQELIDNNKSLNFINFIRTCKDINTIKQKTKELTNVNNDNCREITDGYYFGAKDKWGYYLKLFEVDEID